MADWKGCELIMLSSLSSRPSPETWEHPTSNIEHPMNFAFFGEISRCGDERAQGIWRIR